jgi:hypothetical protein
MAAASEPVWGSVRQKQPSHSPLGEIAGLLLVAAVFQGDPAGERILHADDGGGGAVAGGDFFDDQHHRQIIQPRAAPPFRHHDAHRAQFRQFRQRLAGKGAGALPFRRVGRQPLLGELPQGIADHFLFWGEDHVIAFGRVRAISRPCGSRHRGG